MVNGLVGVWVGLRSPDLEVSVPGVGQRLLPLWFEGEVLKVGGDDVEVPLAPGNRGSMSMPISGFGMVKLWWNEGRVRIAGKKVELPPAVAARFAQNAPSTAPSSSGFEAPAPRSVEALQLRSDPAPAPAPLIAELHGAPWDDARIGVLHRTLETQRVDAAQLPAILESFSWDPKRLTALKLILPKLDGKPDTNAVLELFDWSTDARKKAGHVLALNGLA